jgi:MFS family permease
MSAGKPVREWRRGWPVVLGAAAMTGTGSGLYQNLSSLFVPALEAVTDASRGEIAGAAAFGLLGALAAPFVGRLADRIGVLAVLVVSALGIGAAHMWFSAMSTLWQFQIGIAFLALCAPGTSTLIFGRLIARRFDRHRGLALGLATSGLSLTTVLLPAAVGWVIAEWGWRAGYQLLAVLAVGFGLPLALVAARSAGAVERSVQSASPGPVPSWLNGTFWRLAGATMLINIGTVGMVTQLALIGRERGIGLAAAGLLLSAYGLSQIVGRLLMGVLVDRFPANRIAAVFGVISAAGFTALLGGPDGLAFAMAAVFVAGLLNGAEYDLMPFLVTRLFPLATYGELFGRLMLFSILSGGVGLVGFGVLYDWTGNYATALGIGAVAMLLATFLLYGVPPYDPRARDAEPTIASPSTSS